MDEVATLARTLAVAPERFVEVADEGPIAMGGGRQVRLHLRRRDDGTGRSACVFLVTSGAGRPVCGAGALAPSACQDFPRAPGRSVGCWRTWTAEEVTGPVRDRGHHEAFVARWNTLVATRAYRLPDSALLHALLADVPSAPDAVMAIPEPRSSSGCATCTTARCCVVFDPDLTGADLLRLVDGLGLEPRDVASLRPTRGDQAGPDGVVIGASGVWDLRLRRTAALAGFRGPGGARRCGFLVDLTHPELPAASRCGVYAERPMVCRLFPSDLTSFGVMVGTPEAVCPPQAWSQERADLPTLHTLHLLARVERERFRAFVADWNASFVDGPHDAGDHDTRAAAFMDALLTFERSSMGQGS